MRTRAWLLLVISTLPSVASAQEIQLTGPLAGAPCMCGPRPLREDRFSFAPSARVAWNEEGRRTLVGVDVHYWIDERIGIGGSVARPLSGPAISYTTVEMRLRFARGKISLFDSLFFSTENHLLVGGTSITTLEGTRIVPSFGTSWSTHLSRMFAIDFGGGVLPTHTGSWRANPYAQLSLTVLTDRSREDD